MEDEDDYDAAYGSHEEMSNEGASTVAEPPRLEDPFERAGVRRASSVLSNEEVVTLLVEAFSKRRLADALALLHPDVVFRSMTAQVTQAGEPYCGHAGIRRYFTDLESNWEELTIRPTQIRAAGSAVVALGLASGSGPGGSFEDVPTTWMFKLKDGLVIDAQIFSEARHVHQALDG